MKRLLYFSAALLISATLLAEDAAQVSDPCAKLGWQLAVHAYTFRKFSIWQCMDNTAALGLKYMSLSGSINLGSNTLRTVDLSDAQAKAVRDYAAAKGLTLVNIGVVQLPPDEAQSRKVFEFARKMGIDTLVAEPVPEALDTVEKLCKEYNIKVAIHDHPRGHSLYWNPEAVLAAVKGRTHLMGACADVGHWLRSGLNPVECLRKLQGRIICLHFKDLVPDEAGRASVPASSKKGKGKKKELARSMHDVPWGTGVGNIKAQMAELKRQGFHGAFCIEYEYHWDNSMPEIAKCVKYFNATAAELAAEP